MCHQHDSLADARFASRLTTAFVGSKSPGASARPTVLHDACEDAPGCSCCDCQAYKGVASRELWYWMQVTSRLTAAWQLYANTWCCVS